MRTKKISTIFKKVISFRQSGILAACILMIAVIGIIKPVFLSEPNMIAILRSISAVGIVAVGQTIVILSGEFDVSVGSIAGLTAIVTTWIATSVNMGTVLPIILGLIVAGIIGLINGLVVVKLRIKAFIATIAMLYIARGLSFVITKGYPIYPLPSGFEKIGRAEPLGVSVAFVIFITLLIIVELVLRNTAYGKNIFATGTNPKVAKLLGIKFIRICSWITII